MWFMPIKSPAQLELEEAQALAAHAEAQQQALRQRFAAATEARIAERTEKLQREVEKQLIPALNLILAGVKNRFQEAIDEYARKIKAAHDARVRLAAEALRAEEAAQEQRLADIQRRSLKREENRRIKQERAAARATRVPACERRPGQDEAGQSLTKVYTIRIPADQKAWLTKQAQMYGESVSRLCPGIASGRFSLETSCPATFPATSSAPKAGVSVTINDDDWDRLVAAAARAQKTTGEKLNPVTFVVAAALGHIPIAKPGPRLISQYWLQQVELLRSASRLARKTIPRGPIEPLVALVAQAERVLNDRGQLNAATADRTTELFTQLEKLCIELKAAPYQELCQERWQQVLSITNEISTLTKE
jgi:hypothetical protein